MAETKAGSSSPAAKDKELVKALEKATSDLIEYRWHWTQDDSNDKRVSVADYALAAETDRESILRYAEARGRFEAGYAADESYTAVQALEETNVGAASMR